MKSADLVARLPRHRPVPAWRRWWPLAQREFCLLFRSKWGVAVFCVCLLPLVVMLFVLMIRFGVVDFGRIRIHMITRAEALARWDPYRPEFYIGAVLNTFPGLPLFVLLTATVTAGAVARDRVAGSLELLWTRGISPFGYVLGKWIGAGLLLSLVTVAAPLVLWIFAVLFAEDWSVLEAGASFIPKMLGGFLLVTALWSALCVLVSCVSSTRSQAIVAWCIVMIGSTAVARVLAAVFREPDMRSWLSLWEAGGVVVRGLVGVSTRGAGFEPALIVLFAAVGVLALFAQRRLRVTEAVG